MKETKRIQINGVRVTYKDGGRDFEAEAISKAAALIKIIEQKNSRNGQCVYGK